MRSVELAHIAELDQYGERIKDLPLEPLAVSVCTIAPVVNYEPLALDGILALGMALEVMGLRPFPRSEQPFWMPLPLGMERLIDSLPLWQSTSLIPIGESADVTHYHKRSEDNPYSFPAIFATLSDRKPRRQPSTVNGQYMNYRIPERRAVADRWIATCIGNRAEIARLLNNVRFLGKGAAKGNGRILDWHIEPLETEFSLYGESGPLRPIPSDDQIGIMQGWTPPYWRRDTWRICKGGEL